MADTPPPKVERHAELGDLETAETLGAAGSHRRVWLAAGLVVFVTVVGGVLRAVSSDQRPIPRGISAVDDEVGDAVPTTEDAARAYDRAPQGTDLRRVAVESTGENLIVTFWHVEEIPSPEHTSLIASPAWSLHLWDDGAPAWTLPRATLGVGIMRMMPRAGQAVVWFCEHERAVLPHSCADEVAEAAVRREANAMRVEVPLPVLESLGVRSPFEWAAAVRVDPTPNTAKAWIDCVPGCPYADVFDFSPERYERATFDHRRPDGSQ